MRREGVLILALALVLTSLPAVALPTPPSGPFLAHAPIVINDDANFTAANGVVAGTGAPGDPYVISGWSFTTGGTAIKITNVAKEFVIRDNAFDAHTGVHISQTASMGDVANNQFVVRTTGVYVVNANAHIRDNSFIGASATGGSGRGVELYNSNSRVEGNAFIFVQFAVRAERGSPSVLCNDMHDDVIVAGIAVVATTNATIGCNIVTRCNTAISSSGAIGTIIFNNTISNCRTGINVWLTKDLNATNNTIRASFDAQVKLDTVSGNFTGNLVIDGAADAIVVVRSPVIVANNTVSNNVRVGIRLTQSSTDVQANVVSRNGVGIQLEGESVAHLHANVMTNNTVGIDLPYSSRQTIVNMSANFVNGVNIDGSVNASQRVFFYKEANVNITGQVRDSGFSEGFFGSVSAQGGIVLYEVDTVNVNATVVSHHNIGVGVVNSFNVNVNASALIGNQIGIKAEINLGPPQVPPCVIAVKDTNITIPVDPALSVGIDVKSCLAIVARVNISVVDVGIRVDAAGSLTLTNSTIFDTKLALDVQGKPNEVNLTGNVLVNNRAGARLSGTAGLVAANTFLDNDEYGVRMENGAQLVLVANNFTLNGAGLIDVEPCLGILSCSTVNARGNAFVDNLGDGARVNGTSSWRGDVALGNGGDGLELGSSATLEGVIAAGNDGDGARIVGTFDVEDSVFTGNDEDGLDIHGRGDLRDSNFTFNEEAGIRVAATFVNAIHLNVSFNLDGIIASEAPFVNGGVPALTTPAIFGVVNSALGPDPFDIHRSAFIGNERDAIRAGIAIINATHNYFGRAAGPTVSVADTIGAFQNGVSPAVRFVPFYADPQMTTTGPVAGL